MMMSGYDWKLNDNWSIHNVETKQTQKGPQKSIRNSGARRLHFTSDDFNRFWRNIHPIGIEIFHESSSV